MIQRLSPWWMICPSILASLLLSEHLVDSQDHQQSVGLAYLIMHYPPLPSCMVATWLDFVDNSPVTSVFVILPLLIMLNSPLCVCRWMLQNRLPYQYHPSSEYIFYFYDITIPVSWYTVEVGSSNSIYFRIIGVVYSASKCLLPDGNYTTTKLVVAMCDSFDSHYPFEPLAGTFLKRFEPHANLVNNIVSIIYNGQTSSNYWLMNKLRQTSMKEGLLGLSCCDLLIQCCITPLLN